MPFTVTCESAAVIKRFSGHVTAAEVRDSMQQPLSHEAFDRLPYCINDFSAIAWQLAAVAAREEARAVLVDGRMT